MTRALLIITPRCHRLNSGTSCRNFNRKLSNLEMKNRLTTIARCHELMRERTHWTKDMMEKNMTIPSSPATHPLLSNDVPAGQEKTLNTHPDTSDDLYQIKRCHYYTTLSQRHVSIICLQSPGNQSFYK